jgi:hypothetical protein
MAEIDVFALPADQHVVLRCPRDLARRIRSIAEWHVCAPPARLIHVRRGRSAYELPRAWFRTGDVATPKELVPFPRSSSGEPVTLCSGVPELKTYFADGVFGPRNHDLALFGRASGVRIVIGIEAKADETFDKPIGHRVAAARRQLRAGVKTLLPERIAMFARALFGRDAFGLDGEIDPQLARLPYQLISGPAGTLREAAHRGASEAIFLVHVLDEGNLTPSKVKANSDAFELLCALLNARGNPFTEIVRVDVPGLEPQMPRMPFSIGYATSARD